MGTFIVLMLIAIPWCLFFLEQDETDQELSKQLKTIDSLYLANRQLRKNIEYHESESRAYTDTLKRAWDERDQALDKLEKAQKIILGMEKTNN